MGADEIDATDVAAVLDAAVDRYGAAFAEVLGTCRIWLNGQQTELSAPVGPDDEVAVLPPVSGGSE